MTRNSKSLEEFTNNFLDLERKIAFGYIPPEIAFKERKFSYGTLVTNTSRIISSFLNNDPFQYVPKTVYISSGDDNDSGLEAGIIGVNENKDIVSEIVTLTGQTAVETENKYYSIFRMYNNDSTSLQGVVYAGTEAEPGDGVPDDGNIMCNMPFVQGEEVAANQSLTGIYTIPRGFTGFFTQANIRAGKGVDSRIDAFFRLEGKVFRNFGKLSVYQGVSNSELKYGVFPEKTDLLPLGISSSGGKVELSYDLTMINNDYLGKYLR